MKKVLLFTVCIWASSLFASQTEPVELTVEVVGNTLILELGKSSLERTQSLIWGSDGLQLGSSTACDWKSSSRCEINLIHKSGYLHVQIEGFEGKRKVGFVKSFRIPGEKMQNVRSLSSEESWPAVHVLPAEERASDQ